MRFLLSLAALAIASTGLIAPAAHAQTALEGRVDRLEREMRAVQRKVFPGGAGQLVAPDASPSAAPPPGSPISGPVTNLDQRVTALESQLATMTGQIEQTQYRLKQLEDAFNAYKRTTDARLKAIEDTLTATGGPSGSGAPVKAPPADSPKSGDAGKPKDGKPAADKPAPDKAGSDKAGGDKSRADQVAAVEKPDTGNAAEDQYVYGYRLWTAKLYPEARTQLAGVVSKYPKDRRASYAQNLLGRAYYDDGKYQDAAKAFYENYVKMPDGERAADSLYYLSKTLQKLKAAPAEVCKVYTAIDSEYAGKMSVEQQADIDRGKAAAKCK